MSHLVPKTVIDKNGKRTTVYVNTERKYETHRYEGVLYTESVQHEPTVGGWEIASEGRSGFACPICRYEYSEAEENYRVTNVGWDCIECGEEFEGEMALVSVRADAVKFFDDDVVRETEWYHATTRENWHESIARGGDNSRLAHLGTKEAALQRIWYASSRDKSIQAKKWRIYRVTLKPDVPIHANVMGDDLFGEPSTVAEARQDKDYEADGVTRYVNTFEQVGSVSLVANPEQFIVSGVEEVGTRDEAWAELRAAMQVA